MENVKENDKLIAEFMQKGTEGFGLYDYNGVHYKLNELKFNTSWDWLMPVVSKCYEYGELDNTQREQIIASLSGIIDIEDTHNAVVDFIKQNNSNALLDELCDLANENREEPLTDSESKRYMEIIEICRSTNIDIPFGVEY
jgi:hypothetical protein